MRRNRTDIVFRTRYRRRAPRALPTALPLVYGVLLIVFVALFIAFSVLDNPVRAGSGMAGWAALRRAAFFITPLTFLLLLPLFVMILILAVFPDKSPFPDAVPLFLARVGFRRKRRPGPVGLFFARLLMVASMAAVTVFLCLSLHDAALDAPDALTGRVSVTTGTATGLVRSGGKHKYWQFDVNGHSFTSERQIVQNGMAVRITFYPHTGYMLEYRILG